jgi:SOS-response transcriptional repressor LexA
MEMNKYHTLQKELLEKGTGQMKGFGNSMLPIIKSGSLLTYEKKDDYEVDDIVFCKVRGRFIDAHKITKKGVDGRFMIANNKGRENGWTRQIYGKVVNIEWPKK